MANGDLSRLAAFVVEVQAVLIAAVVKISSHAVLTLRQHVRQCKSKLEMIALSRKPMTSVVSID